jgi:hypothetical protein
MAVVNLEGGGGGSWASFWHPKWQGIFSKIKQIYNSKDYFLSGTGKFIL